MEEKPAIPDNVTDDGAVVESEVLEPAIETILNAAPEDKKEEVVKAMVTIQQELYSGPIPHPMLMAQYEKLLPGSTDRFLRMAERQQTHRMGLEAKAVASQLKSNSRGQVFGFVLSGMVIAAGIVLLVVGMPWLGVVLIVGIVAVLVALFLQGKVRIDADLKSKRASVEANPHA